MTKVDAAWVAGILEGEGCFSLQMRDSTTGDKYPSFCVKLAMTDADIVQRVHDCFGFGRLVLSRPRTDALNAKPISIWSASGRAEVKRVCLTVLSFMGGRRSAKIAAILDHIVKYPPRPKWRHGTRQGYEVGCRCDRCKQINTDRSRRQHWRRKERGYTRPTINGKRRRVLNGKIAL